MGSFEPLLQFHFKARSLDVYRRLAKVLGALDTPIVIKPYVQGITTGQMVGSLQIARNALRGAQIAENIQVALFHSVTEWLAGMALLGLSLRADSEDWMLEAAIYAMDRASEAVGLAEEDLLRSFGQE
ncbi:hypothetical protein [Nocardia concava]|uniref:hypothetical protein n=1 Tax=Nocardia concava TaxID=257281 RepID=UPI00031AB5B1|nr:hypothetical protein [Nocardia concava]